MQFADVNWWLLAPSLTVCIVALLAMLLEPFLSEKRQELVGHLSWFGLIVALFFASQQIGIKDSTFGGMFIADDFSQFFNLIFVLGAVLTIFTSIDYLKKKENNHGEFYPLILFATYGMMVMASTSNLLVMFLGLEIMSVSLYVLAGFARTQLRSTEASIKYFLLGAFATGFTVFGIAFVYGTTGSFEVMDVIAHFRQGGTVDSYLIIGAALLIVGLGFKVAAVPFHMWAADAYEGAPAPVTGFMSAGPKAAAFAALLRIFSFGFQDMQPLLEPLFWILAVLTMTVGNIMALRQNNIKRMLAFSSIAHAGYILIALVVGTAESASAAALYLLCYAVTNLGAFMIISQVDASDPHEEITSIDNYSGLGRAKPFLAILLTVFLISLAGFPPTAGFMGKFVLFKSAVVDGHYAIVIIAVLNSLVSVYYYLRVVVKMFMTDPEKKPVVVPALPVFLTIALVAAIIAVFAIGIYPQRWYPFDGLGIFSLN
ncbi:MAG: NADH-quinone oxidoreductase subunit N [Candidatus Zixiibacteriota bacterium]